MNIGNIRDKSWLVCLSTFPPRQCGIATFTAGLTNAINQMFGSSVESKITAMNLTEVSHFPYPDKAIPKEGLVVHLKAYGFIRVFKTFSWKIEEYHRGLKQTTGIEKCQARTQRSQRSHIFSSQEIIFL